MGEARMMMKGGDGIFTYHPEVRYVGRYLPRQSITRWRSGGVEVLFTYKERLYQRYDDGSGMTVEVPKLVLEIWSVLTLVWSGTSGLLPWALLRPFCLFDSFCQYVDVIPSIPSNPISRGIISADSCIASLHTEYCTS